MRIFLDTNVILEYFTIRERFETVKKLFDCLHKRHDTLFMSVGGFYTMIFIIDKVLKKEVGLRGDTRLRALRDIMERILRTISVAEHDSASLLQGISDTRFKDIEDGCQYELARKTSCESLITFNIDDFDLNENATVQVYHPDEFIEKVIRG